MVIKDGAKMSKSKGNVVDPNDLVEAYGADTVRLFSLFAAPPERDLEWSDKGVEGAHRFLNRIYRFVTEHRDRLAAAPTLPDKLASADRTLHRKVHQTIRKVTADLEDSFHFNTAISAVMELTNTMTGLAAADPPPSAGVLREAVQTILLLLAPMTPHICEELWQAIGNTTMIAEESWPTFDPEAAKEEEVTIVVQVNGKLRSRLQVPAGLPADELERRALADDKVAKFTAGKTIKKVITVPNKLVNIVAP